MKYVFDSSSLWALEHLYPSTFQAFWKLFDAEVAAGNVFSVKEVLREIRSHLKKTPNVSKWCNQNSKIFLRPTQLELTFVSTIFQVAHFRALISKKSQLTGSPVADPFVIAAAHSSGARVVTQEKKQLNAAKIPNVCVHFGIQCVDFEGFLNQKNWSF